MKKNTLSLLETIKRKIKKIDDSDKVSGSGKAFDQEFEYLEGGQESFDEAQEKGQGKVVDGVPAGSNAEDLKLEADIENSTSDANSIEEESSQNNSQIDENQPLEDGENAVVNPDLTPSVETPEDEDDFDLTFENHDGGDIGLGDKGSLAENSFELDDLGSEQEEDFPPNGDFENLAIGAEEEEEQNSEFLRGEEGLAGPETDLGLEDELNLEFNENESLGHEDQSLNISESLPEEGHSAAQNLDEVVGSGTGEESLDFNLEEPVNEDLNLNSDEDFNEGGEGIDEVYEFEEPKVSEEPEEYAPVDNNLNESLESPIDSPVFDDQQSSVPQENEVQHIEGQIQNEVQGEGGIELSERKEDLNILDESYFTAKEQPEEVQIEEMSQSEENLNDQSSGGFSAKSFADILAEEKLKESQESGLSEQESEDFLNSENNSELQVGNDVFEAESEVTVEEESVVDVHEEHVAEVHEEQNQEQEKEMESLIEEEIDPLSQFGDLGLDDVDAVDGSVEGDSNDGLYSSDSPNVIDGDESQNIDFDKELSLGDETVAVDPDQSQEEVSKEESLVDDEQNVEIDNSQKSDDDFMKELELEEAGQKEESEDVILNADIASKVSQSIKNLQDTKAMVGKVEDFAQSDLLSHVAFELMKPKLEQWLNDNLPKLVENVVREEIEKIISTNSD